MGNALKKYEWAWHIIFWICYLLLLTSVFSRFMGWQQALLRNFMNACVLAPLVYFNLYVLVKKFLFREKYFSYAGFVLLIIAATAPLRAWIDQQFNSMDQNPLKLYSVAHYATLILSGLIILGLTTTLKLLEEWIEKKDVENELLRYQLEAELKFLKAQVNPHFLFNALNNIYSLTYLEGKAAAPQILKLSGLMRYMLYESDDDKVPLNKEIEYIQNYLELQSLKNGRRQDIQFTVEGNTDVTIAPLLFIPFFENAFKHGNVLDDENGMLHAAIQLHDHTLDFSIENSIAKKETRKDSAGGIGLENVTKRLELLYKNNHTLNIHQHNNHFIIQLKIQLH